MSQATSAPLMKVADTPYSTCDSAATANESAKLRRTNAIPEPRNPITIDHLRLTVSATIPVGISNSR
ncbi:MAG TPA: hypothetical protein VMR89_05640 [Actinomycetota bacterium]|nr:hypothetical protein [Actinomycetota bacterium]